MADLKLKFKMPDDETLAKYISIKGEKGEPGDPTKTSQLENDSDFTTNAALNSGLATKADETTVQNLASQVATNTSALANISSSAINLVVDGSSVDRWYLLGTLPLSSTVSNDATIAIRGKIGGYGSTKSAKVDILLRSRGSFRAIGDYYATTDLDRSAGDIVAYQQDNIIAVYLHAHRSWAVYQLTVDMRAQATNDYDGTAVSAEPSGELIWTLSEDENVQMNLSGKISADITGDAATVNGHTVEADVPSTAVFTDTIYDDTALRAELDDKADSSTVASTYATKAEVQSVASGAPIPASSTSEMTDTTKVYVNTIDGKWYYYDGSDWTEGGVYQAAEDSSMVDFLNNQDKVYRTNGVDDYLVNLEFVQGSIQGSSTTRLVTPSFYRFGIDDMLFTLKEYKIILYVYDSNGAELGYYKGALELVAIKNVVRQYPTADKYRVLLRRNDSGTITVDEASNFFVDLGVNKAIALTSQSICKESIFFNDIWENIIISTGGYFINNNARLSSRYFFPIKYISNIQAAENSGMEFGIFVYDDNYTGIGYLQNSNGDTHTHNNKYFTSLDVSKLNPDYKYRVYARYTDLSNIAPSEGSNILFKLKDCNVDHEDGGIVITNDVNAENHIWTDYNARLAFGMDTANTPVPAISNQQFVNFGTFILMKSSGKNRWGFHVLEAYDNTNYNRITMLVDKHSNEFDNKRTAELYYYTGANHHASSYGYFKLGSDVAYHSFLFGRDKMLAAGEIDCRFPVTLARISPTNDLDATYETVEEADTAYEPEGQATNNIPCLKYLALKNAANGCMWYDKDRHKVVVKINGKWHDVNTTEVPDGTYGF